MSIDLENGERIAASKAADGYFASKHGQPAPEPYVVITNQRFIVYSHRGVMKKRLHEITSWPLSKFTERLNTSQGTALGSFMHVLTLFADDGETVSTGFKSSGDCEQFKEMVVDSLGRIQS